MIMIINNDNNNNIKNNEIGIETRIVDLQKSAILYSARILRIVLEVWGGLLLPDLKKTSLINILHVLADKNKDNNNFIIISNI